ncbi:xylulose kinase-like [Paramacrobiotus metropolitanus]|uniref:xylulose kinase-like n=1 Tax=Paramacrobiotus metropolitanus TaxID=2943436 RepID=UPI00244583F0|nr:xylulose kinase-like [Paramacrobiotus metropolitanus]XP_055337410.1 xylulose kinase-like [Paramacrobiotus metropolitanus]XP_055337411.1 xylulose kinase-like [Paramacrobiotus metropolitanus]XP_055337412.1 xylulose kinase-like [Paramacrobiotus metropolitanus]XP_055337413.1 xylulose kinase-like [Paramacrobiotus metropolitanus]XP_055337414.1 xylulose kinase-like [Paramacrobiotus metropolitanus]XP_055337415.1 xylulose kinase-like [Paramacrobiotus metropolitanus]
MSSAERWIKMTELFLGLDLSTQQLKGVLIGEQLEVVKEESVHFDNELPEFGTQGGACVNTDASGASRVTVPVLLWVKALDLLLQKLQRSELPMHKILAISGSGQQHGSVYWQTGAEGTLSRFNPFKTLNEQCSNLFSVPNAPIWMDSTTTTQCRRLESSVGGPEVLAHVTGSRAYERFTGPQIAKINEENPSAYENTERISLVSSFLASLLAGKYVPIDWADGSGMNLMDIRRKHWDPSCLAACAPDLKKRLQNPVASWSVVGNIGQYFCQRYGFASSCKIVACTGDNPSSVAGMELHTGDILISLGTSDTVSAIVSNPKPALEGHILCSPLMEDQYIAMLCFKNGSLMREKIMGENTNGTWAEFEHKLSQQPAGNAGVIGLYYDQVEIVPSVQGRFYFDVDDNPMERLESEQEIRALIEGQSIAKRYHAESFGFKVTPETRIYVTGGGSRNSTLLQVIANVFQADVYTQSMTNSAAYGAAYRAAHGLRGGNFYQMIKNSTGFPPSTLAVKYNKNCKEIYDKMVARYGTILQKITKKE